MATTHVDSPPDRRLPWFGRSITGSRGRYLGDVIYGAIDGSVTTFAVVSGVAGAGLSPAVVLILGTAGLIGDGFSMAAGNYLSTRAEQQRDADGASHLEAGKKKSRRTAIAAATATFLAFLLAGAVPLLPYVLLAAGCPIKAVLLWSSSLTCLVFFLVGAGKTLFVPVRWWVAGLESLAIGCAAAGMAYGCGFLVGGLVGDVAH